VQPVHDNRDMVRWLAREFRARDGIVLNRVENDAVIATVLTKLDQSDLVYQQFTPDAAAVELHVIDEPDGEPTDLLALQDEVDQFRNTLFDRRLDRRDGQYLYGRDLILPENTADAREFVARATAELVEELPSVRIEMLRMTRSHGLHARRESH
jgi:hypothetical protein